MVLANLTKHYAETGEPTEAEMESIQSPDVQVDGFSYLPPVRAIKARGVGAGRILDLACGKGYLLYNLQPKCSDLYGLDIARRDIKIAKSRVKQAEFCVGDIRSLPFTSNSFEFISCNHVLEHLPVEECKTVLRECLRVAKPGGVAMFTVPNGKGIDGDIWPEHILSFTFVSFKNLVQQAGFEV